MLDFLKKTREEEEDEDATMTCTVMMEVMGNYGGHVSLLPDILKNNGHQ